ncbi:unnamed protein product [Rotaria sp. Silwood2]|nr:unnamed protein product [Rotaria sp. Silwood2]CAF4083608.1 unnamed protein product [Rotaria sp. Silwood2]
MHLFRHIDSGKQIRLHFNKYLDNIFLLLARIAFNSNGALFFNLRYSEQVFADDLKSYLENCSSSSLSSAIVRRIVHFYYMVACHELSHNIDSNHDLNFINHFERVSVRFMDEKDTFISKFSFQ